jgi:hypothetical protein
MFCALTGVFVGLSAAAAAQVGRDGLVKGNRAETVTAPAAEGTSGGSCSPRKIRYKTSDVSADTSSAAFSAVPQVGVKFTQGGAAPSCVLVRYSAMASATAPKWIPLRVVLDGNTIALPGEIQYEGYTQDISLARSFDFIFPRVKPGLHAVRVEWRSFNGGIVYMHKRTIVVHHR